jgi:hypothetical protein
MFYFVIYADYVLLCAEMAPYPLLNPTIDVKHRAKHMEAGHELPVLVTRTPKSDWMIHPDWADRYVSFLFQ